MQRFILLIITGLCLSTSLNALNPKRAYHATPKDFGLDYEEITITTEDNVNLHAWFLKPGKMSGRGIILSHNGDGNMADLLEVAGQFLSAGFNVLLYDYRGYGKSDDFELNTSFFIYAQFEKDLNAAISYIMNKRGGITNVMLYGQGIGASLSLSAAGENRRVTRVIADSPYSTLSEIQKRIYEVSGTEPLLPLAYNKNALEPLYALEGRNAQTKYYLFIAGDKEQVFLAKDARNLAKIVKGTSSVYVVKGATAATTFSTNKKAYFDEIRKFVQ